ncbi:MAG: chromosome segregation protein SMC [Cyclobacteriaceae bacterium]
MENISENSKSINPFAGDRKKVFYWVLAILILILCFFIYLSIRLGNENERQAQELSSTILQLDSISGELDQRILTIKELGGEVDTLLKVKAQLEEEKKQLLTSQKYQQSLITTLRGKVDGYQELLLMKDAEITELRAMNDQLLSENNDLKVEKQELSQSIRQINQEKSQLQEQVAFASRLKAEGLTVYAVNESGRERASEFRNRHINQLKITFTVSENKVAPIEGKTLKIRVVAPDGNVLFDVTKGSGTFMFEGREMFYTLEQEILYDKKSQMVTLYYDKGSEFAEGNHQVEVYTDSYLMGTGTFIVK